jgi:hypothetical protein
VKNFPETLNKIMKITTGISTVDSIDWGENEIDLTELV